MISIKYNIEPIMNIQSAKKRTVSLWGFNVLASSEPSTTVLHREAAVASGRNHPEGEEALAPAPLRLELLERDLEGGVGATLLDTLPDETRVFPGHMGTTTLGRERQTNPFLRELV